MCVFYLNCVEPIQDYLLSLHIQKNESLEYGRKIKSIDITESVVINFIL
jgi:hypothetical protein